MLWYPSSEGFGIVIEASHLEGLFYVEGMCKYPSIGTVTTKGDVWHYYEYYKSLNLKCLDNMKGNTVYIKLFPIFSLQ